MLHVIAAANSAAAVAVFIVLTLVVTLQVLTRFVLHLPFIWSEEMARFLFFWVVMLGAAMSVRTRRHFVIDVTAGRATSWGRLGRILFHIVPHLCVLGFSIFLLIQGIGYTKTGLLRTATNSRINMALVYVAIPVFALLSIIYSIANLLHERAALARGSPAESARRPGAE